MDINKDNLDSLIDKIRLQVIEYTKVDPLIENISRSGTYVSPKNIFIRTLNYFYDIVKHQNTLYIANLLHTSRPNLTTTLLNIKNDIKQAQTVIQLSDIIINKIEGEYILDTVSTKDCLIKHKDYLEQELIKINELISKL